MTHVTCRLTANNRYQLWDPTLGNGAWATFTFFSEKLRVRVGFGVTGCRGVSVTVRRYAGSGR